MEGCPDRDLQGLAVAVRELRRRQGSSRADLARVSGLSLRYLAELEAGRANISYRRLRSLAAALGVPLAELVQRAEVPAPRSITLLGMRGCGKSTVGHLLADRLDLSFIELDELVESEASCSLGQIFELQGESFYRRLEREALDKVLSRNSASVIATGGGIVTEPGSFAVILRSTLSFWLKAAPEDHWVRVVEQGDARPMRNRPEAMSELKRLWDTRAPLYSRADFKIETSDRTPAQVVETIVRLLPAPV